MNTVKQLILAVTLLASFGATSATAFAGQASGATNDRGRGPFTDGSHAVGTRSSFVDGAKADARHKSVGFLTAGVRKVDPFLDGGRSVTEPRDPFSDGAKVDASESILAADTRKLDTFQDSARSIKDQRDPYMDGGRGGPRLL